MGTYCKPCGSHTAEPDRNGVARCPNPEHPPVSGRIVKTLARGDDYKGQPYTAPYLMAEVTPVHSHGCPATTLGKRHGPCNCGGQALLERFLADHTDDPWPAVGAIETAHR